MKGSLNIFSSFFQTGAYNGKYISLPENETIYYRYRGGSKPVVLNDERVLRCSEIVLSNGDVLSICIIFTLKPKKNGKNKNRDTLLNNALWLFCNC